MLYCRHKTETGGNWELASIHSQEENDLLFSIAPNGGLHLGIQDLENDKTWEWVDGTPVDYENWKVNDGTATPADLAQVKCTFFNKNPAFPGMNGTWRVG